MPFDVFGGATPAAPFRNIVAVGAGPGAIGIGFAGEPTGVAVPAGVGVATGVAVATGVEVATGVGVGDAGLVATAVGVDVGLEDLGVAVDVGNGAALAGAMLGFGLTIGVEPPPPPLHAPRERAATAQHAAPRRARIEALARMVHRQVGSDDARDDGSDRGGDRDARHRRVVVAASRETQIVDARAERAVDDG